jgi:hypothetical protein
VKRVDFNPDDDFKIRKLTFPARDESSTIQPSAEKNSSLSARLLIGLALLALLPRLVNLGSFSMWFDEVAETLQASGSLAYTWAELKSDVVHPPLDGLLTWSLLHLRINETRRRLVPIVFGVVTVLLLASWASRRFGRIAGVATGLFAACSPIHVHYSQELRPYALALFFVALAVVAVDRALDHVDGRRLGLAALALLGCLYSLTGRAVLVAALCGTVGVELLLLHANHWSSPRYDLTGWLFLPVLAGMGTGFLLRLPGGRAVTAAALLFLVFAQALGVVSDHHLRQDWRRVAEAVDALWRPGEPVLTQNRSTNTLLLYYLRELHSPAAAAVAPVGGSHLRLAELWPGDRCALLVLRKGGQTGQVARLTQDAEELARYPASEARVRLLTPQFRERLFRRRGAERSLGRAAPQALALHCERELSPELRSSRVDRPYAPLLRLLGLRSRRAR